MSHFQCMVVASFLSQTFSAAHGEANCPGNVASLPLRLVQSSAIVIPVKVNDLGPFDFMVDTGAQVNSIDISLVAELHLKVQGAVGVAGVATYVRSDLVNLDYVQAGDKAVKNSPAVTFDMTQLGMVDRRVRGILGGSFLEHYDLLIDNGQRLVCLDDTGALASAIKGERIPLAEPYGARTDMPFTRPIEIFARFSAMAVTPVLLRLDSGSNVPTLYASNKWKSATWLHPVRHLKRRAFGIEQNFGVLPPQELHIGSTILKEISFVIPMNYVGDGGPAPREDGVLPTLAYERVFISRNAGYVVLQAWDR